MKEKTVTVRVPGTTANCGPGFDSVGIACSVYNELELTLKKIGPLTIEVYGEGYKTIPCDERNIVWKSMQMLLKKARRNYMGAHIKMTNLIPLSRGLGSSAAAIVAGLVAANAAIGNVFNRQEIFQLAVEIEGHPDNVAPAIFGGVTISLLKDGQAEALSFQPDRHLKLVVAVPSFNLATKLSRKVLPLEVSMEDAVFNVSRAAMMIGALCTGRFAHLCNALDDRLHQPYRSKLIPGMEDAFAAAKEAGALGVALSGAGPCLVAFALASMPEIGEAMTAAFAKHEVSAQYLIFDIDTKGVQVVDGASAIISQ